MQASAVFAAAPAEAGLYESFYLRAVSPAEPVGVWLRYTVHKRPGQAPTGSLWCTVFDAARGAPFMYKVTAERPRVPAGAWIEIDGQATIGPAGAEGRCGPARWSLRFEPLEPDLHHLQPEWLYRAPLPRTKLTSPAPLARFEGIVELPDRPALRLDGWPGMIGHNWGSEHAERWIWLHGCQFADEPRAWLDLAAGRLAIGGRTTPFLANGVLSLDGVRHRLGGLLKGRPRVAESPTGVELTVAGRGGLRVGVDADVPAGTAAGWRYADPDGGEHDVVNCSIAALRVDVTAPGRPTVTLASEHGGAYELGTLAPRAGAAFASGHAAAGDQGVTVAPFGDG